MEQLFKSKISFWHFSLVLIATVCLCTFLYVLGIPIIYLLALGEGVKSVMIESMPINIFTGNWGALIITLFICAVPLAVNVNHTNFQCAKSNLITIIIIFIFYLFRSQIGNLMIIEYGQIFKHFCKEFHNKRLMAM
jgi:hypothetical protein